MNGSPNMKKRQLRAKKKLKPVKSAHTLRFRTLYHFDPDALGGRGCNVPCGESPVIAARSLASVGGPTRRAMRKKQRVDMGGWQRGVNVALLPQWMQGGIAAFAKVAQRVREKYEASKQQRERH